MSHQTPPVEFIFAAIYNAPVAEISKATSAARQALAHEAMTHLDHLYRFASHLTKDQEQAQDLVQETFVRAIAAHEQFIPGTNLKAWLARILYNVFVDHFQRNKRWAPLEDAAMKETTNGNERRQKTPDRRANCWARNWELKLATGWP